ncbi:hypothetical protein SLEP1_g34010 [Rubroshorea leprosula]|uniref:TF-B3 domain-containing protein n=1 Tax=Rubroshorea leprosula TaxID=152421 RepID=A0AAV5KIN2_9ROSI|nr:hypothetical protein SLEP1_g34010 [Rubroshorea leprosula]
MQLFSKPLTSTDTRKRLAIPTKSLTSLLHNEGGNAVELHVRHGTAVWPIMCTTRKKGHKKPVLSKGWRSFALKNKLNVGDIVTLFKEEDEAGYLNYRIEVVRANQPSLQHSGATVGNLPFGDSGEATCIPYFKYEDGEVKRFGVTDEKVENYSFKLFGARIVQADESLVERSDESAAGEADVGTKDKREDSECSKGLSLDLTLASSIMNGPS